MDFSSSIVYHSENTLIRGFRRFYDFFRPEEEYSFLFNPDEGVTIAEPSVHKEGHWAGCPSVQYDGDRFQLYYRLRGKRRGGKFFLAKSQNGTKFQTVNEFDKSDLKAKSVEGASLVKHKGDYLLYISYQESESGKWKIGLTSSKDFSDLDLSNIEEIPIDTGRENFHIKDPVVTENHFFAHSMSKRYLISGTVELNAHNSTEKQIKRKIKSEALENNYIRISSILEWKDKYLVFYDWSPSIFHTWEERSGIALTKDFENFEPLASFKAERGTGSLRYIEAIRVENEIYLYYEISTEEGSHELKLNKIKPEKIEKIIDDSQ